ncbi:FtsX-like permease family protein [Dyella sp. GSA-30]|uniref:ABC transporter permease n=1 Tax=Dyella sp. GSA-30 TaxID=2994496 RepID=UPI002491330B|nr:FtsX-like permease family protein [Dyella sp. GSA-30]BDU20333.1 ABC transporter permease [Dyella sp. GSA-30]
MTLNLRPILVSLRHHKLTAFLLLLQVAVTCAIVSNVTFIVERRIERVNVISGVDESSLSVIGSAVTRKDENLPARYATDLTALRTIPGVQMAVAVDSVPFGGSESSYGTCASKQDFEQAMASRTAFSKQGGCLQVDTYAGSAGQIEALGLKLVAGRDFVDDDYVTDSDHVHSTVISRELAQRLFHGESALGKELYSGSGKPIRVVGIVDTLLRPQLRGDKNQYTMLWPMSPGYGNVIYLLKSAPGDRERILKQAPDVLLGQSRERIIDVDGVSTFTQLRMKYFRRDVTMIGLLIASALGLLFVTALGVAGLANFWVQQRTRQIGIRRAIGATQGDILRYFHVENFLIVTGGIVLGMFLALMLNIFLMKYYELPRLPGVYLPIGAILLWTLGQLAVLGPAWRAARVPPVVATRSS